VVAMGDYVYLRLQHLSPIGIGHCVIEPIEHVASLADAPEEVATEARNFQKCLIRMFDGRGASVVFIEQYLKSQGRGAAMSIECVPLPTRDAKVAPGYFKKAILESDEEWSQHKKLYETRGTVRGIVPPGFSYFDCSFDLQSGYSHHIENETEWKADFGRDVLEGLMEHPDSGIPLARRNKESFEALRERVLDFTKAFKHFDWTAQL